MSKCKNVFIVGSPRSGTTFLASVLEPYFQLSSQGKEPRFFDYRNTRLDLISDDDIYFKEYKSAFNGSSKTLDANPWNFSERSAKAIKKFFPNAHIIIATRDPYDRALSHYKMYVRQIMLDGKKYLTIKELLFNYDENNFLDYDVNNFDNIALRSIHCPTDIIRPSDTLKTYKIYSKFFEKNKIFIFDLDSDKSDSIISKNLSDFLDEEICFDRSRIINSGSNRPNVIVRRLIKKFKVIRDKLPIQLDEKVKDFISSVFPEKQIIITDNDKEFLLSVIEKNIIEKL